MDRSLAQLLLLCAAFWVAVVEFRRRGGAPTHAGRFVLGLLAGVALAHGGWALLHLPAVAAHPLALLDPTRGFSVLFLPYGLMFVAAGTPPRLRTSQMAAAYASLPPALLVARIGCHVARCCHGMPTDRSWGLPGGPDGAPLHPVALYEVAALAAVTWSMGRVSPSWRPALVCVALGGIRLAIDPFRAPPPLGATTVPPELAACALVGLGVVFAQRAHGAKRELTSEAPHGGRPMPDLSS